MTGKNSRACEVKVKIEKEELELGETRNRTRAVGECGQGVLKEGEGM